MHTNSKWSLKKDVFLEIDADDDYIDAQSDKLVKIMKQKENIKIKGTEINY